MELRPPSPHMGGGDWHCHPTTWVLQLASYNGNCLSCTWIKREWNNRQSTGYCSSQGEGAQDTGPILFHTQLLVEWDEINGLIVVVVNFMCQIDWAMGYPAIWLNILGMSRRVFLGEINFWIGLNREVHPPQCGGPCPVSWGLEKKAEEGSVLSARLSWDIGPLLL